MKEYPIPSPHVVVVEDNEDDSSLLKKGIEKAGLRWSLEVLSDGEKFLNWVQDHTGTSVDLFIIDLKVPRITGDILIEKLKNLDGHRSTPVIVLSGSASTSDMEQSARAGCNGYFSKPDTVSEYATLVAAIDTYHFHPNMMYPRS